LITVTRFDPVSPARRHPDLAASGWTRDSPATLWIDLEAPTDEELRLLENPFAFHPLAIEDCLTPEHQPKIEDFGPYLFLIFRGVDLEPPADHFETIKLAAFLGPNYLITYHRRPMRSVAAVRTKYAHDEKGDLFRGVDYLLYEILDHMIEFYFPVLERIEEEIRRELAEGRFWNREEIAAEEARRYFADRGEEYKVELVDTADEVTRTAGCHGFLFPGRDSGLFGTFYELLIGAGGDLFDDDLQPAFDSPAGRWAVEQIVELHHTRRVTPRDLANWHYDEISASFRAGDAAMVSDWPGSYHLYRDPATCAVADRVGLALLPAGPAGRRAARAATAWWSRVRASRRSGGPASPAPA